MMNAIAELKKSLTGFGLIELLITITIIGLISTIAYPSLQSFLQRSHRSEAIIALTKIQYQQEQWRALHSQYANLNDLKIQSTTKNQYYQLSNSLFNDDNNYLLMATPINSQLGDTCGQFALNKFGAVYSDIQGKNKNLASKDCWQN